MANDFSADSNCVALYNFESGALTTDSKGGNTLTDNNTVGVDTSDYQQGAACASFNSSNAEYFTISNGDLDAGHPFKQSTANLTFSMAFWVKPASTGVSQGLVGGNETSDFGTCVFINTNNKISFQVRRAASTGIMTFTHDTALVANRWYHVGVSWDNSTKAYRIRIWDGYNSQILGTDKTGTGSYARSYTGNTFYIGSTYGTAYPLNGKIDEVVIFKDVKSAGNFDAIRAGTYGSVSYIDFSGSLSNTASLSAALKVARGFSGSISTASSLAGILGATRGLSGGISANQSLSGTLGAVRSFFGSISSAAVLSVSGIHIIRGLSGAISAIFDLQGALYDVYVDFSGQLAASSALNGNLTLGGVSFSGQIQSTAVLAGTLTKVSGFLGSISSESTLAGVLTAIKAMGGSIICGTSMAGNLTLLVSFGGSLFAVTDLQGALVVIAVENTLAMVAGADLTILQNSDLLTIASNSDQLTIAPSNDQYTIVSNSDQLTIVGGNC